MSSVDYFTAVGVMFTGYCVVRGLIWWQFRMDARPVSRAEFFDGRVPVIDAVSLSKRLEQVRQSQEAKPQGTLPFKKSFLVESRREQLAQSSFFQRPPQPERPEDEHGMTVLLV